MRLSTRPDSTPLRLAPSHDRLLRELCAAPKGFRLCPGGFKTAGQVASNWWRAAQRLFDLGFAVRCSDGAQVTANGRAFAARVRLTPACQP